MKTLEITVKAIGQSLKITQMLNVNSSDISVAVLDTGLSCYIVILPMPIVKYPRLNFWHINFLGTWLALCTHERTAVKGRLFSWDTEENIMFDLFKIF